MNDLTEKRFGRLVVQWPVSRTQQGIQWLTVCDCGNLCIVQSRNLSRSRGATQSCGCFRKERATQARAVRASIQRAKQVPSSSYTFLNKKTAEKDSGILPNSFGISNDFAKWKSSLNIHGGMWISRKFDKDSQRRVNTGLGFRGLWGRMRYLIRASKTTAKTRGYNEIRTSPEEMLRQWKEQQGKCKACGYPLNGLVFRQTVYDHDHETGMGRGFIHSRCNTVEGFMKSMSDTEILNLVEYVRSARDESFFRSIGL